MKKYLRSLIESKFAGIMAFSCLLFAAFSQDNGNIRMFSHDSGGNGHYYSLVYAHQASEDNCLTWNEAHVYSAHQRMTLPDGTKLWGHLATVTSREENRFITKNFVFEWSHMWIGAFRLPNQPDTWQWITQEPWAYTNWFRKETGGYWNEPTDMIGEEQIQMLNFGTCYGCWFDYHEYNDQGGFAGPCELTYGIIEYEKPIVRCVSISTPDGQTEVFTQGARSIPVRVLLTDIAGNSLFTDDVRTAPRLIVENESKTWAMEIALDGKGSAWRTVIHPSQLSGKNENLAARIMSGDPAEYSVIGDPVFRISAHTKSGMRKSQAFENTAAQVPAAVQAAAHDLNVRIFSVAGKLIASWSVSSTTLLTPGMVHERMRKTAPGLTYGMYTVKISGSGARPEERFAITCAP